MELDLAVRLHPERTISLKVKKVQHNGVAQFGPTKMGTQKEKTKR